MQAEAMNVANTVTELMDPDKSSELLNAGLDLVIQYGPNLIFALLIFFIGKFIANIVKKMVQGMMAKSRVDPLIIGFTSSLVYMGVMIFIVMAALGQVGIQTTSFIAILGAAGLAIGLALQGSLANFAAGFLLIIFRPFKEGDVIEAAGVVGKVEVIQIFTTTLKTPDNKTIIIPNNKLGNDNIINYSTQDTRRVDLTVGVSYDADLKEVRTILEDIVAKDQRILKDPTHLIVVGELADNSVNFFVRVWVKSEDYWNVYFDANETVKLRLDAAGIGIPYPQRDVHLYEHKAA
ncbi:mechanosensitive ion channel family protein [sulfur-oxidizing endosymbiont of Gigantopelta aegis]|uniref:mechanosensitive ion channel family protein n=1 Tax=sulfur-oxidizing endosymbiont of Gigantopelta aegis TaxID=2794934 RepID=UPI0018DD2156|nr:mechanosensitive ion channel domain-containing protein [sulfur-oxidizing endosymbiont of Gigantopelta aegis]